MIFWLWAVMVILSFIIIALLIKIHLMRKSAREIKTEFAKRLITETNTLITISSRDSRMRELADAVNSQLRQLRRERHRFQQGDLELKESITNISHDLRTPLTAICGYLDLLEQEEKSETVQRYVNMIENRTEAMKQLTEELFQYSVASSTVISAESFHIISGESSHIVSAASSNAGSFSKETSLNSVDLRRVLEESLVSFYGVMQQKDIVPQISLPENPVERTLDSSALGRIFSNIISNALKYSDGDLEVSLTEDGRIIFANSAENLSTVEAGRLFDRFYTVENARNSTGLGLSIAKLLTEHMDGEISAEYRDGRLFIVVWFCG